MTVRERLKAYQDIGKELADSRESFALKIAFDTKALVADRVQNTGVDANGSKMKGYNKQYAAFRKAYGLPIDKRTLTFTGDMWSSVRPEVIEHNEKRTVVETKARDTENQAKVNYNSKIVEISILAPDKQERQLITDANQERIDKIKAKYF